MHFLGYTEFLFWPHLLQAVPSLLASLSARSRYHPVLAHIHLCSRGWSDLRAERFQNLKMSKSDLEFAFSRDDKSARILHTLSNLPTFYTVCLVYLVGAGGANGKNMLWWGFVIKQLCKCCALLTFRRKQNKWQIATRRKTSVVGLFHRCVVMHFLSRHLACSFHRRLQPLVFRPKCQARIILHIQSPISWCLKRHLVI